MQQYHQQFTTVTSLVPLLRTTSDHSASLRIKEKPYDRLKYKMGRDLFPLTSVKQTNICCRWNMYMKTEILYLNQADKQHKIFHVHCTQQLLFSPWTGDVIPGN